MHRTQLLTLLAEYQPLDPEEIAAKEKMISFVQQHPNCFERSLLEGHITASAWLLSSDFSRVLLTHHKKFNLWMQLGGHCDGDSDVLAVALKEAREESGIEEIVPVSPKIFDLSIHHIPFHKNVPEHYHYDVRFLLQTAGNEQYVVSSESHDLQWFSYDPAALTYFNSDMARMVDKWGKALTDA